MKIEPNETFLLGRWHILRVDFTAAAHRSSAACPWTKRRENTGTSSRHYDEGWFQEFLWKFPKLKVTRSQVVAGFGSVLSKDPRRSSVRLPGVYTQGPGFRGA